MQKTNMYSAYRDTDSNHPFIFKLKTVCIVAILIFLQNMINKPVIADDRFFEVQAVDTVKYSRDLAQDKNNDPTFDNEIEQQVVQIASVGTTHIALGTPYDEEFIPFLRRWVQSARKHNLNVWYRGNFAGWEGWFEYDRISRDEHTQKTIDFIKKNPDLFENGDIFTSCPECENGGPGDPRQNGDTEGHRKFLINEYTQIKNAFKSLNKQVKANYYSMNGDVAKLIMDRDTTNALDGIVTIDHYVLDNETFMNDVNYLKEQSGGSIVIGEIGAPIPDIQGEMTDEEQALWIEKFFKTIIKDPSIIAVNYWVNRGGTTRIWNEDNSAKPAAKMLKQFYKPRVITGTITDDLGFKVNNVNIETKYRMETIENSRYAVAILDDTYLKISKEGYVPVNLTIQNKTAKMVTKDIILIAENRPWYYEIVKAVKSFLNKAF